MRPGLQLRTAQGLALTPQLQQAIRLLQLSTLELQQELDQMLADNPFLELATDTPEAEQGQPESTDAPDMADTGDLPGESSADWQDDGDDNRPDASEVLADKATRFDTLQEQSDDWSEERNSPDAQALPDSDRQLGDEVPESLLQMSSTPGGDGDAERPDNDSGAHIGLHAHLHEQALSLRLEDDDRAALYYLIESLNDDGYLEDSLDELVQGLLPAGHADPDAVDELRHHLTVALRLLQSLEPAGVGARDLAECLRLQLQALPPQTDADTRALALALLQQPLEYLARRDVRSLGKRTGHSAAALRSAMQLIATLEPKPGRRFAEVERNVIVPDVLVQANPGSDAAQRPWLVHINPGAVPRVRVHEAYAHALRQHKGESSQTLQQHLQEARWMVKSIQQRFDTILRVSQAIVVRQQRFFAEGVLAMEPLVLRDIADELGLHESTISRVTSAKYMQTPWGTFELKYFFGSGLTSDDGGATSSTAVRALIAQLIADEPPSKPLSDNRLCELLQQQGIHCARRTVAKYREAMRIAPAHLRKSLG